MQTPWGKKASRDAEDGSRVTDAGRKGGETAETRGGSGARFVPASLKDARWVVGLLLLAVGVVGTLRVISSLDDSVQVWTARTNLVPGQRLEANDLVRTAVRLDDAQSSYLSGPAPTGVVQRPVGRGELVPRSAVADASSVDVRAVSVTLDRGQADVVRVGTDVEVWVADKSSEATSNSFERPRQVIDRALVSRIGSGSGGVVAVADGQPVELVVPRESLAEIIDAGNSGSRITLVPLAGSRRS
ncbi:hypothetical protein FV141_09185 [Dermacoccus abyssi]|uniref:SAF domain-containing protein n=1 Tax=Dermacoccus abyssi TaxID=322596 RepID=A0ABX5ZAP8_9MICO|nr:hypothetical protein FV141_09185 [Dermacoccus abyssi]